MSLLSTLFPQVPFKVWDRLPKTTRNELIKLRAGRLNTFGLTLYGTGLLVPFLTFAQNEPAAMKDAFTNFGTPIDLTELAHRAPVVSGYIALVLAAFALGRFCIVGANSVMSLLEE